MGAVVQLALGAVIGAVLGAVGGWLLRQARKHGFATEEYTGIAVLALALLGYTAAVTLGANGFVAAFCGGLAFGTYAGRRRSSASSSRWGAWSPCSCGLPSASSRSPSWSSASAC